MRRRAQVQGNRTDADRLFAQRRVRGRTRRRALGGPARVLVALLLSAGIAAAVSACGSSGSGSNSSGSGSTTSASKSASTKHVNIAMFLVATANTDMQGDLKGAEAAAKHYGNATIRTFNGNFSPATQVGQIEAAVATGQYNAMIIDSVDGTQVSPAIDQALNAHIAVVCGFAVCGPDQLKFAKELPVAAQVSTNYLVSGLDMGNAVVKACAGLDPCNAVYLQGTPALAAEKMGAEGIYSVLNKHKNIKIVASPEGDYVSNVSDQAMQTVIEAHPNINVVFTVGDQEAAGAQEAIDQSPLKGKVKIIGNGASVNGTKQVKDGNWYGSVILRPYNEGYLDAEYAIAAARGKPLTPDLVNPGTDSQFPSGVIYQNDAAKWKPEWAG